MNGLFGEVGEFGLSRELQRYSEGWGNGEKGKKSSHRGLPVWETALGLNLFSCLTFLGHSKINRAAKSNRHAG